MTKQILTGGGQIGPRDQMHGVPGTMLFRNPDPLRPYFMQHGARVSMPAGIIRNLRFSVFLDGPPSEGFIGLEVHSTGVGSPNPGTGTGLHIKIYDTGTLSKTDLDVTVEENDQISMKVGSHFVGPSLIAFTYSFEFEMN